MKPNLFAEDILGVREGERRPWSEELESLARILPRRYPSHIGHDKEGVSSEIASGPCNICEGRGWLYPDKPESVMLLSNAAWHVKLEIIWQAMGILE